MWIETLGKDGASAGSSHKAIACQSDQVSTNRPLLRSKDLGYIAHRDESLPAHVL
jgi:hypothetical protein